MARTRRQGIVIAGGGVAGSLAALAMAKLRPEVPLLLVGEEPHFGGSQDFTCLEGDLGDEERQLTRPLSGAAWPGFYVAFPDRSRSLKLPCLIVGAQDIDRAVRATLGERSYRTGARIVAVREDGIVLQDGEKILAEGAIDAREATNLSMLELGWRRSLSREYALPTPHRLDRPVLIDSSLRQGEGCHFTSCTPLDHHRLIVEDVTLGRTAELDVDAARARLDGYVEARGWAGGQVSREQASALPLALGGDFPGFWRFGGARVAKLGPRGGYFHPMTGSPLADAARTALLLARQRMFAGAALHDVFERDAAALWARRDLYRSLNAAMLGGEGGGCEGMERLYGLEPALLSRLHGERLGLLDRRRVMAAAGR